MRLFNNIIKFGAVALFAASLMGCKDDNLVKPSALISESSLTFEATNAEPQQLTVASDDSWMIDVDSDWISVDPMSGTNTVKVNVEVEDNVDANGVLAAPRQGIITIANKRGYSVTTVIYQKGDTYLGAPECSVTSALDLDSASRAKVLNANVAAVATTGFVVTDGTSNMYVEGVADIKPGDVVEFNGTSTKTSGIPSFILDEVQVKSTAEVSYPTPVSIDKAPSVLPEKVTYVKLSGTLVGTTLRFTDKTTCTLLVPADAEAFNSVNTHKVDVLAYFIGTIKKNVTVVPVSFIDNGQDENVGVDLPFRDDFSWLEPYIAAANSKLAEANKISDCVGAVTSSSDGCANLYTTLANNGCDVIGQLRERGYTDLNPGQQTIYLQDAYFKFGRSACQSGLTLPLFKMTGEQDIVVSFKWCSQLQGDGNIDDTKLVVAIDGPGVIKGAENEKISNPIAHTQGKGQMFWQDASVTITGASTATAVTIRPEKFGSVENPVKGYYRFYMDDIEVMLAADAVTANIDIKGVDNDLITFEGTPEAPVEFSVNADADYNVTSSVNWLHIENGSGVAGTENTVKVTCDPSELSTMRKAQINVKAGVTTKTITVIQSAAGQTLEPFLSIVGGNSTKVIAAASTVSVKIQSNVSFKFDCDANWISMLPQTSALVNVTEGRFAVAANTGTDERVAHIRFYNDQYGIESVYTVTQLSDHAALPVKWTVRSSCNFKSTWPFANQSGVSTTEDKTGYVNSTTGIGTIWFSNANGVAADVNKKCVLDVSDNSPRVMGVWIGDFCQFKVPGKVDAGRKVRISFETRTSATHPKYWRLQYLDGTTWKDACATKTVAVEGEGDVVYTHQMNGDGKTNIQVDATVTYVSNTDNVVFRFVCQTAMQANGKGCLAAPNGGSWRLSVTDTENDTWQPTIQFVD